MPTFPQVIAGGIGTQLPYVSATIFNSRVSQAAGGKLHVTSRDALPSYAFELPLTQIDDSERQTLENFFTGPLDEFVYLDPAGNLIPFSEVFSDASWVKTSITVGAAVAGPLKEQGYIPGTDIGVSLAATSADSDMRATVVPSTDVTGFVFCLSVYVRAATGGQNLQLAFRNTAGSFASSIHAIPQTWKRISLAATMSNSDPLAVQIGGGGTWDNTTIEMFGAMCAASPGPGRYARSPGRPGLHAKCRFSQDVLPLRAAGSWLQDAGAIRIVSYL